MKPSLKLVITTILGVVSVLVSGCPLFDNNSADPKKIDAVANRAVAAGRQAIESGLPLEEAIRAAVAAVENDPLVVAASVDDEDPRIAWVMYTSGLEHVFEAIDLDEEIIPDVAASQAAPARQNAHRSDDSGFKGLPPAQSIPGLVPFWRMPANRNALLVNALTRCHPLRDVRPKVRKMLTDRGYVVEDTIPLDIELFRNDNLMKYGVIFMETHGGIRTHAQRYNDRWGAWWYKFIDRNIPYCNAGPGGSFVISTDVLIDPAWTQQYKDDLECGLLKYTTTYIRQGGRDVPCVTTYGVTPDFIRRYNTARFADRTLVCMNACRSFNRQGESEWANLLKERGTDPHLVGWDWRVHYDTSATAFLNLFQLTTGSDETLTMTVPGLADPNVVLLRESVPPVGASTVVAALGALTARSYDVDLTKGKRKGTGARLLLSANITGTDPLELVLVPEIRDFWIDQTGRAGLTAACQDHAEFRVEHGQTQSGVTTADIGTYGMISLGGGWVSGVGAWSFTLPVGSAGRISLAQDNRTGPPRDLLRWAPVFKITGSGAHNLHITAEFRMNVRAIPGPRWRSGRVAAFAWDKPTDLFDARFDGDASVVTWSVSGGEDVAGTRYSYSGGGVKNLSFVDAQGQFYRAEFSSSDGQTAVADFECSATMPYTETITDLGSGQITVNEHLLPISGLSLQNLSLAADWTVQAGTQPISLSGTITAATVSWGNAQPTPPYNAADMRR